jgi:hypothetical protein
VVSRQKRKDERKRIGKSREAKPQTAEKDMEGYPEMEKERHFLPFDLWQQQRTASSLS